MAKMYFERIKKAEYNHRKALKYRAKKALFFTSLALNIILITYVIMHK